MLNVRAQQSWLAIILHISRAINLK